MTILFLGSKMGFSDVFGHILAVAAGISKNKNRDGVFDIAQLAIDLISKHYKKYHFKSYGVFDKAPFI